MVVRVKRKKAVKRPTYKKAMAARDEEGQAQRRADIAYNMRRYRKRKAGDDPDLVDLELAAPDLGDEKLAKDLRDNAEQLKADCGALAAEMDLKLSKAGYLLINRDNMRKLYERTWASAEQLAEEDEDDEENDGSPRYSKARAKKRPAWKPSILVRKHIRLHFQRKPFDRIRLGILKVVDPDGKLTWFEVNDEQAVLLDYVEKTWYNGVPCLVIVLKARQIGSSTFWTLVHYCYQISQSYKKSHVVMQTVDSSEDMLAKFRLFFDNDAYWNRPWITGESPLQLEGNGVRGAVVNIESAERGERVGRGQTYQFNHLSEIPYWKDGAATFNAMLASMHWRWPLIHVEESTGKTVNDAFYNRFHQAFAGNMEGFKAFFFPWFMHKAYRMAIPRSLSVDMFRATLSDEDIAMWDEHGLEPEQVYWYVKRREIEVTGGEKTTDEFRKEYPSTIEDAFIGSNSNFFDPKVSKDDLFRTRNEMRVRADWEDLKESVTSFMRDTYNRVAVPTMKATLFTDEGRGCQSPKFSRDDNDGLWTVWERPRPYHRYIVTADTSEGRNAIKNSPSSSDYDVIDVWRYTHEPGEPAVSVQVAQCRGRIGAFDLAAQAVAASEIYADKHGGNGRALIIPERNNSGAAFIEEARRLGGVQYHRITYGKNREVISKELGFKTTAGGAQAQGSKTHLLMRFRGEWMSGRLLIMSPQTAAEMSVFINNDGKLEAMSGHHDDTVIAAGLFPEGVKYAEGEIVVRMVEIKAQMADLIEDAMSEFQEEIDINEFKAEMLGRFGSRLMEKYEEKNRLASWL